MYILTLIHLSVHLMLMTHVSLPLQVLGGCFSLHRPSRPPLSMSVVSNFHFYLMLTHGSDLSSCPSVLVQ